MYDRYTDAAHGIQVGTRTLGGVNDSIALETGEQGAEAGAATYGRRGKTPDGSSS